MVDLADLRLVLFRLIWPKSLLQVIGKPVDPFDIAAAAFGQQTVALFCGNACTFWNSPL